MTKLNKKSPFHPDNIQDFIKWADKALANSAKTRKAGNAKKA
jgi:hypothetical protein